MPASPPARSSIPARSMIAAAVVAALGGIATSATASNIDWFTGDYLANALPNPIPAQDTIVASGPGDKNFSGVNLTIQGGLLWQTDARLGFLSSSITNNSLIDIAGNASLVYAGGNASSVVNNNTFRKSAGAGVTTIGASIVFVNSGMVDAQSGSIDFAGGLATFNANTQFIGAGVNRVSGNAAFNGAISSTNLLLSGGTFTGSSAALAGTTTWSGGQFSGSWSLPANAVLTAVAGGDKNFSGATFTNTANGTIAWTTTNRIGFLGSTLQNQGLIDIQADANLVYAGGNASTVTNSGVFRKSAGNGTTSVGSNIQFTNSGVVDAQSGTIDFAGGLATFNGGTQFTGAGVNRVSSSATFVGAIQSQNLVLAGGTFSGTGALHTGGTSWTGGQFSGTWTNAAGSFITAATGGDKNFSGATFDNAGTLAWNTTNRMGFLTSTLQNSGLIDIQADANVSFAGGNASTITNTGTFRKSGGGGTTTIGANIAFTNTGVIDAQSGVIDFGSDLATFNAGTQFTGAGQNRISSNATFNGAFTASNLRFAAGSLNGGNAVLDGSATWTGGQFQGTWQLPANRTLQALAGGDKNFTGVTFANAGTLLWTTTNRLGLISATLQNSGLIDIQADANVTYAGGNASTLANTGTLRKSAGSGTTTIGSSIIFTNSGIVDAQTGTIDFAGGSATFNAGTQFTGAGINRISSNATFVGAFTSANLVLASGTYSAGGPTGATIQGAVSWTGGQFGGQWTLAAGQTVSATGAADKNFSGATFFNNGTLTWATAGRVGFVSSLVQNNNLFDLQADANLTYAGGSASTFTNSGSGIFRKSAGGGTSSVGSNIVFRNSGMIDVQSGTLDFVGGSAEFLGGTRFTGAGAVRVSSNAVFSGTFTSGNLRLASGSFAGANAVLNGVVDWTGGSLTGNWQIASGQTLTALDGTDKNFSGTTTTNQGTLVWQTANRLGFVSASVVNQGLLDIQADANLTYAGGNASTFTNEGVFRKSAGSGSTTIGGNIVFTNPGTIEALSGTIVLPQNFTNPGTIKGIATVQTNTLTNTGVIAPGASPGTLTLAGNLVMSASGSLDIELESTTLHDTLAVTGSALLDGTLVVRRYGAYAPKIGDSFTILTYAQRLGNSEFDGLTTLGFGGGVLFDVSYGANAVTLSVAAVPEPETYVLMLLGLAAVAGASRRLRRGR